MQNFLSMWLYAGRKSLMTAKFKGRAKKNYVWKKRVIDNQGVDPIDDYGEDYDWPMTNLSQ